MQKPPMEYSWTSTEQPQVSEKSYQSLNKTYFLRITSTNTLYLASGVVADSS